MKRNIKMICKAKIGSITIGKPAADYGAHCLLDSHNADNWRAQIEPLQPVWNLSELNKNRPCRLYSSGQEVSGQKRETERKTDSQPKQEALCSK